MAADDGSETPYTRFACIGTGFSGIGLGAQLQRWYDIDDVAFFERQGSLGGTWLANRYPGCACDVPSALYSFSFAPNADWSRVLPPAAELWAYLDRVADAHGLRPRMTFGVEVRRAEWFEDRARWRLTGVRLTDGRAFTHECQFLFGATGQLVRARDLDVPGLERFAGESWHSSAWRRDVELADKRVVVFGNGCTAAQVVPSIVDETRQLTQIVRSKHWYQPPLNTVLTSNVRMLLRIPGVARLSRLLVFLWAEDQLRAFYMTRASTRYRKGLTKLAEDYMRKTAPDKYHNLLIPDFPIGCKRRIFDPGYLKSLHAENLEVTDTQATEIVPEGVKLADGRIIEADVIVACTGFKLDDCLFPIEVVGVGGETIKQHWAKFGGGPEAYNCSAMSGFPNFFALLGPNSLTGHTSAIMAAENSINYALRVIKPILDGQSTVVELSSSAETAYVERLQDALSKTVLAAGCGAWYTTKLDSGKEWNATIYPWSQAHYWWRSLFPVWNDWQFRGPVQKRPSRYRRTLGRLVLSIGLTGALAWLLLSIRGGKASFSALSAEYGRLLKRLRRNAVGLF